MPELRDQTVIETRGLSKDYKDFWGRTKVRAVNRLDLVVRRGEIFGLLGPNGSGKTTTLKLLLGLLHPSEGTVRILGGTPAEVRVRARIGFLPEETYLHKFLNAEETLDFYGQIFRIPGKERRARTRELLVRVGIDEAAAKRALREYSKGMMRRIGLAQALVNDPDLLILDEPTSGLDPIGAREVKDLLLELKKRGKTILLSSHLLADVEGVCDRIAILHSGNLRKVGDVHELLRVRDILEVRLRAGEMSEGEGRALLDRVSSASILAGAEVVDARNAHLSLEELFLRTIGEADGNHPPTRQMRRDREAEKNTEARKDGSTEFRSE